MAKKLATPGEISKKKKKPSLLLYVLPGVFAIAVCIVGVIIFAKPTAHWKADQIAEGQDFSTLAGLESPAAKLAAAYGISEISADSYARYLCDPGRSIGGSPG
jgi:hypothetical protein